MQWVKLLPITVQSLNILLTNLNTTRSKHGMEATLLQFFTRDGALAGGEDSLCKDCKTYVPLLGLLDQRVREVQFPTSVIKGIVHPNLFINLLINVYLCNVYTIHFNALTKLLYCLYNYIHIKVFFPNLPLESFTSVGISTYSFWSVPIDKLSCDMPCPFIFRLTAAPPNSTDPDLVLLCVPLYFTNSSSTHTV